MTYTDLREMIAAYLHRNDATTIIPSLIEQAEARFNRLLRCPQQEETAYNDMLGEYISIPANMLAVRAMVRDSDGRLMSPLRPVDYRNLIDDDPLQSRSSNETDVIPHWCTEDMQFRVYPHPTPTDTLRVRILFYAKIPPLAANSTNWLLTDHPDIYVAQCLLNGLRFFEPLPGSSQIEDWKQTVTDGLVALNSRPLEKIAAQTLKTDILPRQEFNVYSGW